MFVFFFFFKQKTAYEMRISDWSSDVCSSDLAGLYRKPDAFARRRLVPFLVRRSLYVPVCTSSQARAAAPRYRCPISNARLSEAVPSCARLSTPARIAALRNSEKTIIYLQRSEERRVGKECVSTFRSRRSPYT